MDALQLKLLGTPEVSVGNVAITESLPSKAQAILYYLAATGEPQTRPALAGLLWGDMPDSAARTNLRKALSSLRDAVGDYLDIDRQFVAFKPESDCWADVVEFVAHAGDPAGAELDRLETAVALYRHDFLTGFYVLNAPDFEDWMLAEQTRLRELAAQTLQTLTAAYAGQGELAPAIRWARRLLNLEPWREEAHRQLMQLLAQSGQRGAALAQYQTCREALEKELRVEPDPATQALYEAIRAGATGGAPPDEPVIEAISIAAASEHGPDKQPQPPHNLQAQPTPFIGREQELADIIRRINDPACRLLTLIGPGGIGKTRLALQAAQTLVETEGKPTFADGIFFVPLAPISAPSGIVSAIAEAAGFNFYSNVPPQQQLLAYLQQKKMLLVLDNFEHVSTAGSQLVAEILAAAPAVKVLATSREALNLQEAWFHPIEGLAFPDHIPGQNETTAAQYDAVRLFEQSARRARVGFSLEADLDQVVRICRTVEGMPLGIELAAAWLKVLPLQKIADEIERSLDILSTRLQNVPERHRSIRAVFENSWQLLADDERELLRRLAVFRGSFEQEAVEQITGGSLMTVMMLVEKSLLRATGAGRYQMHELLRQFASEKLEADPQEMVAVQAEHCRYYLAFLSARREMLGGKDQQAILAEVGREAGNIRAGWQWAVAQNDLAALATAADSLYQFYQIRSRYNEGREIFAETAARLQTSAQEGSLFDRLYHQIIARQGAFCHFLGDYETANIYLSEALMAAHRLDDRAEVAFILNLLGQVAGWQGNLLVAKQLLQRSLAACREIGDQSGTADALHKLAQIAGSFGEYGEGKQLAGESLALSRQLGRPDWIAYALDVLGWTTVCLGQYVEAEAYYKESLEIFEQIGDRLGMALALGGIGSVAWATGGDQLEGATQYMERSLAICREIGHRHHTSSRLWYLGQIAHDRGEYEQAKQYAGEGLAIAREVGSPIFASYNLCCLGETACAQDEVDACRSYLMEALSLASEARQWPTLNIALLNYARLLVKESTLTDSADEAASKKIKALELLAVIAGHPACWHVFKGRAAQPQAWLEAELPAEVVDRVKAQAEAWSLEEGVAEVINSSLKIKQRTLIRRQNYESL